MGSMRRDTLPGAFEERVSVEARKLEMHTHTTFILLEHLVYRNHCSHLDEIQ